MSGEIRTAYGLRSAYYEKHPNGHFFDDKTLKFFGETMSSMRVLKEKATITDCMGEKHTCYVLSSLQRKHPGGPKRKHSYFDIETIEKVIPMDVIPTKELVIVVERGMIIGVYSDTEALSVSVIDLDTTDPDRREETEEQRDALQSYVDQGKLKEIWRA